MPNTYTQLYIQFVFAVKYRTAVIDRSWKDELYKYMTGIVQNQKHNCYPLMACQIMFMC